MTGLLSSSPSRYRLLTNSLMVAGAIVFLALPVAAYSAKITTGDDDDLSDLEVQRKATPDPSSQPPSQPPAASATKVKPGSRAIQVNHAGVLLVDDDASDNNSTPGNTRLSASDTFFRKLLQDQSLAYDVFVVARYANGPGAEQMRAYPLIIWYTGASYGGNRDNTAVISVKDEETLRRYLIETGGTVILFSPGYLNNALGSGGEALWAGKQSAFLQEVFGVKGGRGLLQRFKEGNVISADGVSFNVSKKLSTEAQFSPLNPAGARTIFSAVLDPDGSGPRPVAVATSQTVGQGHMVYVGFTFENIAGDAGGAFGRLMQAAGATPMEIPPQVANPQRVRPAPTRTVTVPAMTLTGAGPTSTVTVPAMTLTGAGPTSSVTVPAMMLTGAGPTSSVSVPVMMLTGAGPTSAVMVPTMLLIGADSTKR